MIYRGRWRRVGQSAEKLLLPQALAAPTMEVKHLHRCVWREDMAKGRIAAGAMILFFVSGCGESASDRITRADINARNAIFRAERLADKVSDLEARLDAIEKRLRM